MAHEEHLAHLVRYFWNIGYKCTKNIRRQEMTSTDLDYRREITFVDKLSTIDPGSPAQNIR